MVYDPAGTQSRRRRAPAAATEASSGLSFKHLEWSPGVSMWPLRAFWQFISWLRRARDLCLKLRSCRSACWSVYLSYNVLCLGTKKHAYLCTCCWVNVSIYMSFTPARNLIPAWWSWSDATASSSWSESNCQGSSRARGLKLTGFTE